MTPFTICSFNLHLCMPPVCLPVCPPCSPLYAPLPPPNEGSSSLGGSFRTGRLFPPGASLPPSCGPGLQRAVTYMSRFRQWRCYIYVTFQAVAVLHICHASGNGGVIYLSRFRQWRWVHRCHASGSGGVTYMSRFRQWRSYIHVALQAVAVLHLCHASGYLMRYNNVTPKNPWDGGV
jgi:hypothetical protein